MARFNQQTEPRTQATLPLAFSGLFVYDRTLGLTHRLGFIGVILSVFLIVFPCFLNIGYAPVMSENTKCVGRQWRQDNFSVGRHL